MIKEARFLGNPDESLRERLWDSKGFKYQPKTSTFTQTFAFNPRNIKFNSSSSCHISGEFQAKQK